MSKATDALEACGVPYKHNGWMPAKPPQSPFFAAVMEESEAVSSDSGETFAFFTVPTVELYDDGGADAEAKRAELLRALAAEGLSPRRQASTYIYSEKKFLTVYDCEGYIEKE